MSFWSELAAVRVTFFSMRWGGFFFGDKTVLLLNAGGVNDSGVGGSGMTALNMRDGVDCLNDGLVDADEEEENNDIAATDAGIWDNNVYLNCWSRIFPSLVRPSTSKRLSQYSFSLSNSMIFVMWRGILSVHAWILSRGRPSQVRYHIDSAINRDVKGPLTVVRRFIQGQQGEIMLRSGEFPGYKRRSISWREKIEIWCLEAWDEALFSCTIISDNPVSLLLTLHFWKKEMSIGRKMTFW